MAKIKAFKALRPVRDKVHLVATRPYFSYKKNVLKAKLQSNPYTFLRIINPEFGLSKKERSIEPQHSRFNMVKSKYDEFIREKILFQDDEEHLYVYRQTQNGHEYVGVIGGASVEEYQAGKIKKHEATITSREEMFVAYLDVIEYNAEPVLLCHEPCEALNEIFGKICTERPEYEFTTTDKIKHELWCVATTEVEQIQKVFEGVSSTYIADGHHRSASSSGLFDLRQRNQVHFENQSYFLSFFIDETKLKIYEYNRLVKNVTNKSHAAILSELEEKFLLHPISTPAKPEREHDITMCLSGNWYRLTCKPEILDTNHPVKSLDAEILTQHVLSPILDIHDLKTDPHIEFIAGVEKLEKMERKMVKDGFDILFILYPVRMDQVKKVADNEMIMPPKSTWVEPKMRSGLTIYHINE